MDFEIVTGGQWPDAVEALLRELPEWFGIEEANRAYVEAARTRPSVAAIQDGDVVGIALVCNHFPEAAELELLAVRRELHRHGIGRRIVQQVEADARAAGVRLLQVKTRGPSDYYEPYERTRAFYESIGFLPLEELLDLWPSDPCLVMVKPL
jgi:GNAT superfamily N-acetyltransferase